MDTNIWTERLPHLRASLSKYDLSGHISRCRIQYHSLNYDIENLTSSKSIRSLNLIDRIEELRSTIATLLGMITFIRIENPFLKIHCDQAQACGKDAQVFLLTTRTNLIHAEVEHFDLHMIGARSNIGMTGLNLSRFLHACNTLNGLNSLPPPALRKEIQTEIEQLERSRRRRVSATKGLILVLLGLLLFSIKQGIVAWSNSHPSIGIEIAYLLLLIALAYALVTGKIKSISLG